MSNNSNTVLGVLAGTAIGATLGILFAPDKGSNTRKKIVEEASATRDRIADEAITLKDQMAATLSTKKETLDDQLEAIVSDASHQAEDLITSLEKKLDRLKARTKKLQKTS
ncbi:YtxH domain-containing protein [Aquimarina spongiae]|uniref:Gas vesicle protein n=1 Tax=Aquimarina spongiae TaxID=570521 RepID=A0A1M6GNE4_9FLAO|nr:YtxH domain-containing protein [Aquimarina spongiae]SHJ11487.1 Gas vesicle protein [Aquimarina spongiae]